MSSRLEDESAIRALMDRYGSGVDERDWDTWATIFADPLETDFSGIDPAFEPATLRLEQHVAGTRAVLENFDATQHMITKVQVVLDGDQAQARAVMCRELARRPARGTALHHVRNLRKRLSAYRRALAYRAARAAAGARRRQCRRMGRGSAPRPGGRLTTNS